MSSGLQPRPARRRLRVALAIAIPVVVLATAAAVAWAGGVGPFAGHGHGAALAREHAEFRIHRALAEVGASDQQEEQILAMVDSIFERFHANAELREQLHDRIAAALTADPVDRAALEAARTEILLHLDQASRELVGDVADMAEVLTLEQRSELAELHQRRFE
jgi:Spy/CpxP family protein refolding chaperone